MRLCAFAFIFTRMLPSNSRTRILFLMQSYEIWNWRLRLSVNKRAITGHFPEKFLFKRKVAKALRFFLTTENTKETEIIMAASCNILCEGLHELSINSHDLHSLMSLANNLSLILFFLENIQNTESTKRTIFFVCSVDFVFKKNIHGKFMVNSCSQAQRLFSSNSR